MQRSVGVALCDFGLRLLSAQEILYLVQAPVVVELLVVLKLPDRKCFPILRLLCGCRLNRQRQGSQ